MNFRQGFFRLWVVGSVLFVVAVGLFSYTQVASEFERSGKKLAGRSDADPGRLPGRSRQVGHRL